MNNEIIKDIKKCCRLSISSYHVHKSQSSKYIRIDGLTNIHKKHDAQAVIKRETEKTYVAFRGSSSVDDFKDVLNTKPLRIQQGTVHSGFFDQFLSIQDMLLENLEYDFSHGREVVVSGHSMGGAVALITTAMLHEVFYERSSMSCYTFGAPVVADATFLEYTKNAAKSLKCIELKADIVPYIPLHHSFPRLSTMNFGVQLQPPSTIPPVDILTNHSCITYLQAINAISSDQNTLL